AAAGYGARRRRERDRRRVVGDRHEVAERRQVGHAVGIHARDPCDRPRDDASDHELVHRLRTDLLRIELHGQKPPSYAACVSRHCTASVSHTRLSGTRALPGVLARRGSAEGSTAGALSPRAPAWTSEASLPSPPAPHPPPRPPP